MAQTKTRRNWDLIPSHWQIKDKLCCAFWSPQQFYLCTWARSSCWVCIHVHVNNVCHSFICIFYRYLTHFYPCWKIYEMRKLPSCHLEERPTVCVCRRTLPHLVAKWSASWVSGLVGYCDFILISIINIDIFSFSIRMEPVLRNNKKNQCKNLKLEANFQENLTWSFSTSVIAFKLGKHPALRPDSWWQEQHDIRMEYLPCLKQIVF